MRSLSYCTALAVILIAVASPAASASSSSALRAQQETAQRILYHDAGVIRFFHNHPWLDAKPVAVFAISRAHRQRREATRWLRHVRGELNPSIDHMRLWRCIAGYPGARYDGTTGESGGDPRASNGTHFNVLQMTNPWRGVNPIGMSPRQVMRVAEEGYAASGYSRSWLEGQWGQTVGPCLTYA